MASPLAQDWTHTAVVVGLPPDEVGPSVVSAIQEHITTVLASPEFDEVSVQIVALTPGSPAPTSPTLESVVLTALTGTEASTISVVWCGYPAAQGEALERDLDALHAERAGSPLVQALRLGARGPSLETGVRDTVIQALDAADGTERVPRGSMEAILAGIPTGASSHDGRIVGTIHGSRTPSVDDSLRRSRAEHAARGGESAEVLGVAPGVEHPGGAPIVSPPTNRSSGWLPPIAQKVVSSVSSQVDDWRTRAKVRRAEEQIGISEMTHLPLAPGVMRPRIYFALAASNDWDKHAVRTLDAALTLVGQGLDHQWIAVAVNLAGSLTRVAGPASAERIAHDWKRIDRSNEFDLGGAASALQVQIARDTGSLLLRGHKVGVPHVVIFATEPPYVDSSAHTAYLSLLAEAQSVTWMLVGDSDWMDVPTELQGERSRVLQVEQDGVAVLLREVLLAPPPDAPLEAEVK